MGNSVSAATAASPYASCSSPLDNTNNIPFSSQAFYNFIHRCLLTPNNNGFLFQYLTKQAAALRDMNESRMKIYEQLELSMIDLEKGNTRLKEEAHVDKERVRGLTATVATLELRCEELQRCLDDVVLRRVGSVEDRAAEERHPPGVVCQVSKVMGKHVCKTEICTPRQFMWLEMCS